MNLRLFTPTTADGMEQVRALFQEYAAELGLDLCFQNFDQELARLPGCYAAPEGKILLAESDGGLVGCVALRPLTKEICEMKRMYVRPAHRSHGVGRLLAATIIREARSIGYVKMRLDTLSRMQPALRLYLSLGFYPIPAYYHNPQPDVEYLELNLI